MSIWTAQALRRAQEKRARRSIMATAILGTLITAVALIASLF